MKRASAILLLVLFTAKALTPAFDLACEFQKLPNLLEHFEEHRDCTGDSFLKFLAIHFINITSDLQHQDGKDHENLPFHGNHCEHITVLYAHQPHIKIIAPVYIGEAKAVLYSYKYPVGHTAIPFHPPKV